MEIAFIQRPLYRIVDNPAFEGYQFSGCSPSYDRLDVQRKWADAEGKLLGIPAVLQSPREAWGYRIASAGADNSSLWQATRGLTMWFRPSKGSDLHVAYTSSSDPAKNPLLGFEGAGPWTGKIKDIRQLIDEAENDDRVFVAPGSLVRSTQAVDGKSPYGQEPFNRMLLEDMAEPAAKYLDSKKYPEGITRSFGPQDLKDLDLNDVHYRWVCVGGDDDYYGIGKVSANGNFGISGWARAVASAQKNSP